MLKDTDEETSVKIGLAKPWYTSLYESVMKVCGLWYNKRRGRLIRKKVQVLDVTPMSSSAMNISTTMTDLKLGSLIENSAQQGGNSSENDSDDEDSDQIAKSEKKHEKKEE